MKNKIDLQKKILIFLLRQNVAHLEFNKEILFIFTVSNKLMHMKAYKLQLTLDISKEKKAKKKEKLRPSCNQQRKN